MSTNAELPANPVPGLSHDSDFNGLTKREHFAGLVLQGLVASWGQHDVTDMRELAEDAVSMADALLAELERTS